jgi:hypothetical protein
VIRCLHTGFHPHAVADVGADRPIERDQEVDGAGAQRDREVLDPRLGEVTWPRTVAVLVDRTQVGLRSSASAFGYSNPMVSAQSSMKKSKGLITFMSAISPTVMVRLRARFGKTNRARKLPNASCCQLMK